MTDVVSGRIHRLTLLHFYTLPLLLFLLIGKWVCNPHRISELMRIQNKKCVVFSIGSNNDFSFEMGIRKELPDCEIHTFDHTVTPTAVPEGVQFHKWGLSTKDSGNMKTLSTIMKTLNLGPNHSLEILKVDVEGAGTSQKIRRCLLADMLTAENLGLKNGSNTNLLPSHVYHLIALGFIEWDIFAGSQGSSTKGIFEQEDFAFVRQILIELHPNNLNTTRKFFELAGKRKYVITHKEPNTCRFPDKHCQINISRISMIAGSGNGLLTKRLVFNI